MNKLDDVNYMRKLDPKGMLEMVDSLPEQFSNALKESEKIKVKGKKIKGIVVCGMGGSGIVGDFIKSIVTSVPVFVIKDYTMPEFIDSNYLAIVVSYSGNTEETLSLFQECIKRGVETFAISSGGKLERLCGKEGIAFVKVKKNLQPRAAIGYMLVPALKILSTYGLFRMETLREALRIMERVRERIGYKSEARNNPSKKIARTIGKNTPIIYSSERLGCVAYRAKTQFNENSKIHAFFEPIPEMNHNGLLSWKEKDCSRNFIALLLRDKEEHERVKIRFDFLRSVLEKRGIKTVEIHGYGRNILSRMLSTMFILDYASVYLAFLLRRDPGDISLIDELKRRLSEDIKSPV